MLSLEESVRSNFGTGISVNTDCTYSSGKRRFLRFCALYDLPVVPSQEKTLCLFVAFLTHEGVLPQSIHVYLSAVRHLYISWGFPDAPSTSIALCGHRSKTPGGRKEQSSHSMPPSNNHGESTESLEYHIQPLGCEDALGSMLPRFFRLPQGGRIYLQSKFGPGRHRPTP